MINSTFYSSLLRSLVIPFNFRKIIYNIVSNTAKAVEIPKEEWYSVKIGDVTTELVSGVPSKDGEVAYYSASNLEVTAGQSVTFWKHEALCSFLQSENVRNFQTNAR